MKKIILLFLLIFIITGCTLNSKEELNNQDSTGDISNGYKVNLLYNNRTGELYPLLPEGANVHTCVWTILGDHGSQMTLATKGHFISNDLNNDLASNKFLPPRVPIYVSCVNWENKVYYGSIGEY